MGRPVAEREVPAWWREQLDAWMHDTGTSQVALARQVGCDRSLIAHLISKGDNKVKESAHIRRICEITGIPYPHKGALLAEVAEDIEKMAPGFVDAQIEQLRTFLAQLQESRKKK